MGVRHQTERWIDRIHGQQDLFLPFLAFQSWSNTAGVEAKSGASSVVLSNWWFSEREAQKRSIEASSQAFVVLTQESVI